MTPEPAPWIQKRVRNIIKEKHNVRMRGKAPHKRVEKEVKDRKKRHDIAFAKPEMVRTPKVMQRLQQIDPLAVGF